MSLNLAQKLIGSHLLTAALKPGAEIGLRIDQTLTQDATGTLVMLELEALGLDRMTDRDVGAVCRPQPDPGGRARTPPTICSCARLAALRAVVLGPGQRGRHPMHIRSVSAGPGQDVAGLGLVTRWRPGPSACSRSVRAGWRWRWPWRASRSSTTMPRIWGVRLTGRLPQWVSAKDVCWRCCAATEWTAGWAGSSNITVPGLDMLTAMDRHVIANMGAELGATTQGVPRRPDVRRFLRAWKREGDWGELLADQYATYDIHEETTPRALSR